MQNKLKTKTKIHFRFHCRFCFNFHFCFFLFLFSFSFLFLLFFFFIVFIFKFYYGTSRPPQRSSEKMFCKNAANLLEITPCRSVISVKMHSKNSSINLHFWEYSTGLDDIKIKVITMVLTSVMLVIIYCDWFY